MPRVEPRLKLDYALQMSRTRHLVIALALFASASASAEKIFRWVDADGRTYYSDRPQPGAQRVDGAPKPSAPAPTETIRNDALLGPYRDFEIVSPEADQTLRKDDGQLPVSLILDPPLILGHRLELVVDGAPISVDHEATQLSLTGLAFGSHRAQAQIRNTANAVVARTTPVTFHLRKPTPPGVLE